MTIDFKFRWLPSDTDVSSEDDWITDFAQLWAVPQSPGDFKLRLSNLETPKMMTNLRVQFSRWEPRTKPKPLVEIPPFRGPLLRDQYGERLRPWGDFDDFWFDLTGLSSRLPQH